MARSARQAEVFSEPGNPFLETVVSTGRLVGRNPTLVGGSTAFLVALFYISANAIWYQPHAHSSAFFSTRSLDRYVGGVEVPETTIRIERPAAPRQVQGDPVTKKVQGILKQLNFYDGTVDGLAGPNTKKAVETYQRTVGLPVTGTIDNGLLDQLDASPSTAAIPPKPAAAPRVETREPAPERFEGADAGSDARIMKIQAGLRAFGNDDIKIDGVMGARTRAAIHEFQVLFGLPGTGEPDDQVYAKMRETGLTN